MIEYGRYCRMIYHLGKDIEYLEENLEQHKTVLQQIFGTQKYRELKERITLIRQNHKELKEDLNMTGFS